MEFLIQNRVNGLLPWVEKRLWRAVRRSDTKAAFAAVRLMDWLTLMEINADQVLSRDQALSRLQRWLHSN
jgi:hypothetical protein